MFQILKKYSRVLQFFLVFLGSYLLFTFLYKLYLDFFFSRNIPDFITSAVALQTEAFISVLGYDSMISANPTFPLMNLYVNDLLVARIIEGCNSVSIIILFVAFMLSFFGKPKNTLLFILLGVLTIYLMNIGRIAILSIGIYEFPQYAHFLHQIVFPLIIYGTVFLLWLLWILMYSQRLKL